MTRIARKLLLFLPSLILIAIFSTAIYAQPIPELIYFRFNSATSGTVTNDAQTATRVSNVGNLQGTTVLGGTGIAGTALQGNGGATATNSINANWPLNLSGPWTLFIWFKGYTNALTNNYCFGGQGGSAFRAFTGSGLVSGAGNLLVRGTGMTDVPINGIFNAAGAPVAVHIVYNPATANIRTYVNGVLYSTVAQSATMTLTGTNFTVGGYATNNGTPNGGFIDEFRLYNRALAQAEITATYNIELNSGPPCSGTPTAGTVSAPPAVCPSTSFNLSLTGNTTGSGITYQWQSKPTSGSTFTNIAGATVTPYATTTTVPTDYRCIVTCTNTSSSSITTPVTVGINSFNICYCKGALGGSTAVSIDSVSILQTTLNNSTPGTAPGFYTQYPATGNTTTQLQAGGLYTAHVKYGASAIGSAWLDANQNGVYENSEWIQINTSGTTGIVTFQVPPTAVLGQTGLRIRSATSGSTNGAPNACTNFATGETEDYIITIVPAPLNDIKVMGYLTPTETKMCPFRNVPVKVVIYNNGSLAQTGFDIVTKLSGVTSNTSVYTYTGTLAAFRTDTLSLTSYTFAVTGNQNLRSYTTLSTDANRSNDTSVDYNFTIMANANTPVPRSDSACIGEEAMLHVLPDTFLHHWYTDPNYINRVYIGDTMKIPSIQKDSFLYVCSKANVSSAASLSTVTGGTNGCGGGAMFNIVPTKNLRVDSFAALFSGTGTQTVNVYYRLGTFAGFETNSGAWTLLGTTSINVTTTSSYTNINVGVPLNVAAGNTYGIYVNYAASYTNGTTTFSNADMSIQTGTGLCSQFGGTNAGRMYNGTVYYSNPVSSCESPLLPINAYVGPRPIVNLGVDLKPCEDMDVILDGGFAGGSYLWNTLETTQTISVKNKSGQFWVEVTKYCTASDTVIMYLQPKPKISGVSFVRNGNEYIFNAAGPQDVNKVMWIFGDGGTDYGSFTTKHTYANSGAYKVLCIISNDCGDDTTALIIPLGISSINSTDDNVALYPNPANDKLTIDFTNSQSNVTEYQVISNLGKVVLRQKDANMNAGKLDVDVSALPAGNYIIKLVGRDASISKPFIINR